MVNVASAINIPGWMSELELRFLAEHASESKIIVEAGSYCGRSTRAMADNTKGIIYAIDPWSLTGYNGTDNQGDLAFDEYNKGEGERIYRQFKINLSEHIESGRVQPQRMQFHDFYLPVVDMIFLDACHEYSKTKRDILHALLLMTNGGFLCGHDYASYWPGVIRAVDQIFGKGIEVVGTIWWIKL